MPCETWHSRGFFKLILYQILIKKNKEVGSQRDSSVGRGGCYISLMTWVWAPRPRVERKCWLKSFSVTDLHTYAVAHVCLCAHTCILHTIANRIKVEGRGTEKETKGGREGGRQDRRREEGRKGTKKEWASWEWWHMPMIPNPSTWVGVEGCVEFKTSLQNPVRPCLKSQQAPEESSKFWNLESQDPHEWANVQGHAPPSRISALTCLKGPSQPRGSASLLRVEVIATLLDPYW